MINAKEAQALATAFDFEGANKSKAAEALHSIDGLIRSLAAKGENHLRWVIDVNPANYHSQVFKIVKDTLVANGYIVDDTHPSKVWTISW